MMYRLLATLSAKTVFCSSVAVLAGLGMVRPALADEACGDTTCPEGFTCETTTLGCPLIACAEGEECEPCEPEEIGTCVPASCTSDDSCGAHMVCAEIEQTTCSAVAEPVCPEGEECVALEVEPECETTTVSQCTPQWELPCTVAADCGEGFTCEEVVQCACSGSAGAVAEPGVAGGGEETVVASGGAAATDPDEGDEPIAVADDGDESSPVAEDCECTPTGEMQCEPIETACSSAADCPPDWTCEDNPESVCWADTEGNSGCEPADPPMLCRPPYSDVYRGVLGVGTTMSQEGNASGAAEAPTLDSSAADDDSSAAEAPTLDSSAADDDSLAETKPAGEAAPSDDDEGGEAEAGGGCSVAASGGDPGSVAVLLAGLAAMLGLRRRRR